METNKPIIHMVMNSNEFVGISMKDQKIDIYVPQVFRKEKDEKMLYKDLLVFLKSIEIAKTIEHDQIETSNNQGESWAIDSFLWIIRDFLENGYYYNREKTYSHERNGKIDWKRTLRNTPIYSDGNLIYDKLVTSKMTASNDVIAQIFRLCLKISIERIGWAYDYMIAVEAQQLKSVKEMIYLINKEISSTFDDIKKMRFRHMIRILQGINKDNALSHEFTYGITNYYYVFEVMIDTLFHGIHDKSAYNPEGYWKLNGKDAQRSSNLRPDTIYLKDNQTFIIDAKMYQYGVTKDIKDLPKASSMQKQITYGDFVHNYVDPKSEIRNAFILPFNKESKLFKDDEDIEYYHDHNFAYIGEAFVNYRNTNDPQSYDRIFTFMIDFNYLLKNHNMQETIYIDQLCNKINEILLKSKE